MKSLYFWGQNNNNNKNLPVKLPGNCETGQYEPELLNNEAPPFGREGLGEYQRFVTKLQMDIETNSYFQLPTIL